MDGSQSRGDRMTPLLGLAAKVAGNDSLEIKTRYSKNADVVATPLRDVPVMRKCRARRRTRLSRRRRAQQSRGYKAFPTDTTAAIVRGLPVERYRSCADTRSAARSDRSNGLGQTLPGRDAWSACHYLT